MSKKVGSLFERGVVNQFADDGCDLGFCHLNAGGIGASS
jgi:hypothetical protein